MPRLPQSLSQALCERHMSQPPAFRYRDVTFPLRASHAELPFVQIDVGPLQRHDFAASQSRLTTQ